MVKSVFGPKSVLGIAAATMLAAAVMPTVPANAAPIQNAPGIAEHQSGVETVNTADIIAGIIGGPYVAGSTDPAPTLIVVAQYYYGGGPYAYGAPYPYYRGGYYGARPFVGIGPFGFGVW